LIKPLFDSLRYVGPL